MKYLIKKERKSNVIKRVHGGRRKGKEGRKEGKEREDGGKGDEIRRKDGTK